MFTFVLNKHKQNTTIIHLHFHKHFWFASNLWEASWAECRATTRDAGRDVESSQPVPILRPPHAACCTAQNQPGEIY